MNYKTVDFVENWVGLRRGHAKSEKENKNNLLSDIFLQKESEVNSWPRIFFSLSDDLEPVANPLGMQERPRTRQDLGRQPRVPGQRDTIEIEELFRGPVIWRVRLVQDPLSPVSSHIWYLA